MPQFTCPQCNSLMDVSEELYGTTVACPHCGQQLRLPEPLASAPPTRPLTMSRIIDRRFQPATSLWDLFDLKFEKYVTPLIIRATWIVVLSIACLWMLSILGVLVWTWLPEIELPDSQSVRRSPSIEFSPPSTFGGTGTSGTSIWLAHRLIATLLAFSSLVSVCLLVLWIRVSLETVIVIFNIAKTLTSMDSVLKKAN